MSKRSSVDLIGIKHGYVTAISEAGVVKQRTMVKVLCDCGREAILDASHFRRGLLKSCTKCDLAAKATPMAGKRFGAITVLRQVKSQQSSANSVMATWECRCDCGNIFIRSGGSIRQSGQGNSCGCLKGASRRIHGMTGTRVYRIWMAMRRRCNEKTNPNYPQWGGRGIRVCKRWDKFANFYADMGDPPTTKHTIDRIDNDGNYKPTNCRWSTHSQQSANRRNTIYLTLNGRTQCLTHWAREVGLSRGAIRARLRKGWGVQKALKTPRLH